MRRIYSFGYKMNGEDQFAASGPAAPVKYDCRGIQNPHNTPALRKLNGRDKEVQVAVLQHDLAGTILANALLDLRDGLDVAFGCSYGKHRSVALAELLHKMFPDSIVIHTGAAKVG